MKIDNLNFVNVKTISVGPIISKELIFDKFEDVRHFLECLKYFENRAQVESLGTRGICFTDTCELLKACFSALGFMPRALPKPSTDFEQFIEFIWDLDSINKKYKEFYNHDNTGVINFEYDQPVRTPEGWSIKNFTIWVADFKNEEVL